MMNYSTQSNFYETSKINNTNISVLPDSFYPTPQHLIEKMCSKINYPNEITDVLEPSAGKGNIIYFLTKKIKNKYNKHFNIDYIETDTILQQNISSQFSKENVKHYTDELKKINSISYNELTAKDKEAIKDIEKLIEVFKTEVHLVHDDFLTYSAFKKYDLIIMNPPFHNGDKHLLKAIEIMSRGGQIICILNAETLKNPYTNTRKDLLRKLEEMKAEIEYLKDEFLTLDTERKTCVEIALIKINIAKQKSLLKESNIFENLKKSKQQQIKIEEDKGIKVIKDYIEIMVDDYNLEVEATLKLIEEYEAFKKYIPQTFNEKGNSHSILKLVIDDYKLEKHEVVINEYLKIVRMKYWKQLFSNKKFTQSLTSNLLDDFMERLDKMANYDFSIFNVKNIQLEIVKSTSRGIKETILNLFEKLSQKHSYYDETSKNIHYFNGWKTNKAYKINNKVIIPCTVEIKSKYEYNSGCMKISSKYFDGSAIDKLRDIEKVFNYLDGNLIQDTKIDEILCNAANKEQTSKIELKYFNVTFYKKGTCHIVFTNQNLLAKLNLFGAQNKNWLPPCYGKKSYSEMNKEEKTIIDDFQGEEDYNTIMKNKDYYFINDNQFLSLTSPS